MKCSILLRTLPTLLALLTLWATGSSAVAAEIIDVPEVEAALKRGAILWDVRDAEAYAHEMICAMLRAVASHGVEL